MYDTRANNRNPGLILHCDCLKQNKLYFLDCDDGPDQYSNKFNPMIICNPFTGNFVELPKAYEYPGREVALGFGYHPTTKEYKVVQLLYFVNIDHGCWLMKSDFQVFTLGTDKWRSLGSLPLSLDQNPSEALLNGALHWVTMRHQAPCVPGPCVKIISFDIAKETFREIPLPPCGSLDICNNHLVVLGQCLSGAVCGSDGTPPPYSRPWKKSTQSKGAVQVVCTLKNGEILLQYMNGALVLYNPENEEFKDLVIPGLPKRFCTIVHVKGLFSFQEIQRNEV
ncbi:hypothetical protein CRYUN_Cryun25bG0075500 [Craigia yunnanensis]